MQHFCEVRQHGRVDGIGLGILAYGHGEGSGPARIDSEHFEARALQGRHDLAFVTTGGFQQNPANLVPAQAFNRLNKAF
ncbi:hypothetical protein D3C76_1785750 [compost metagenome]